MLDLYFELLSDKYIIKAVGLPGDSGLPGLCITQRGVIQIANKTCGVLSVLLLCLRVKMIATVPSVVDKVVALF